MNLRVALLAEVDDPIISVARAAIGDALRDAGDELVDAGDAAVRIRATLDPSLDEQGYEIARSGTADSLDIRVVGGGRAGLLYGLLHVAEISRDLGVHCVSSESASPDIRHRGIKFNVPLDARTPGYADDGDAAQANVAIVWELDFWRELFDRMAGERYNLISLWNLHPFPSMVRVPGFENVALADVQRGTVLPLAHTTGIGMFNERVAASAETVKRMTIDDKIAFWNAVMQLAHDRCIEVMIFTWNVYSFGTEGSGYGIDDTLDSEVTKRYFRASVRALLTTYPLLAGIGVTAGEHMDRHADGRVNQLWLRETYGAAIADVQSAQPDRQIRLIHRTHWAEMTEIVDIFGDVDVTPEFSYKYSSAHLHALSRPHYIDQDGFLDALPDGAHFWLTVRDDDFYLLRPGDPEFVREYLARIPDRDRMNGFYLGPDGYILGREFLTYDLEETTAQRQLVFDRQWYQFAAFGRLAYDPTLDEPYFIGRLASRYPGGDAATLYRVWREATTIIPVVNRFHFGGNKYDLDWYPEACLSHPRQRTGFHTVHDFVRCQPMPTSGMVSIPDAHAGMRDGILPDEVARSLRETADRVASSIPSLRAEAGSELESVLGDLLSLAHLGRYYSEKILGAVAVHALTVDPPGDTAIRALAVGHLTRAARHWHDYADSIHSRYRPQRLSRLGGTLVDLHALQAEVEYDVTLGRSAGYDEHRAVRPALPDRRSENPRIS
ncbi:hypothetical protein [Arthrobacter sp. ZGTC131]|uniref:hypothetical protein n=1 Tax=Arthrobacter sp. ZGTC131 TaxID=2058898 RepID=UPI000CE4BC3C|nr:hypothetical protein [Arthrobacter sp. ZGTC131]